jgi:hypothetical protein
MKKIILLILIFILLNFTSATGGSEYLKGITDVPLKYGWWIMSDCSSIITNGECCWDNDDFTYCCGNGSSCVSVGGGASTSCSGTTTYLDGEGNCDDISGVYVQASDWTTIDNYPAACTGTSLVQGIGDTLTCTDAWTQAEEDAFKYIETYVRESPSDSDSFLLFKAPEDLTITDIDCIVDPADSGESVIIDVQECDSAGDNCVTVDATITCDNDGASDDGSLSNGSIDSGDWLLIDTGTVTGTVTQLSVTILYQR